MNDIIPLYPLAAVIFLAAAAIFALQMARHLRVFAAARPATVTDHPQARVRSTLRYAVLQVRMFRDRGAGVMHAIIAAGSSACLTSLSFSSR